MIPLYIIIHNFSNTELSQIITMMKKNLLSNKKRKITFTQKEVNYLFETSCFNFSK